MYNRFIVRKLTNDNYVNDFFAVIDRSRNLIIRWYTSSEAAQKLCDLLNKEEDD